MTDTSAVNCPLWTVLADTSVPKDEVFPISLIIMILERISSGEDRETLLKLLKSGADLDSRERHMLRELIENSL